MDTQRIEQLKMRYNNISSEIKRYKQLKDEITKEYLSLICPHKVGDIVTIKGYYHHGKQGVVENLYAVEFSTGELTWGVRGRVLKKDGTPSNYTFQFNAQGE